jgi:hypothetical protein
VPLFHAAALYLSLIMIHYWDVPAALGIGDRPLSADMAMECLKHAEVDSVLLPPAILEELSQMQGAVEVLKKTSYVAFGGGKQCLREGCLGKPSRITFSLTIVQGTCRTRRVIDWSKRA